MEDYIVIIKNDNKYNFVSMFNPKTGSYLRTGILDENGIVEVNLQLLEIRCG